ncbi:RsiV family protein [Nitratidesulfovibrio sp. SRB-5]|uniref:RsiV family protein n=1 Tax=Nitratidesulfovibrio sp. SRB-5 TaxID=2872636 RepID=UPI001025FE50|nr:DUF3298 and DUF4163 domain-containing protein [Nitratidesulfovibrio sp. SRB-5]MBZ2172691.1 DUF3298 and DUF4163 domain-containing protein [Nitratidesulfovibrio sp. SRB-5]RXF77258.1 DUF3298 domain-containing protein [Desulfovibrio sp. DS-1]
MLLTAMLAAVLFAAALWAVPVRAAEPGAGRDDEASITLREDDFDIDVRYPRLGQPAVDDDLARWAAHIVAAFRQGLAEPEIGGEPVNGTRDPNGRHFVNELKVTHDVTRASARAATVTFSIWTYTGGAHGNLDIITQSYDMASGARLAPEDIFADTEGALALLAPYCYEALAETLGEDRAEDMLRGGTSPDADNYASLALTPDGVRVHFSPYQVAPWSAGPQRVDVPLGVLIDAGPRLELWGVTR